MERVSHQLNDSQYGWTVLPANLALLEVRDETGRLYASMTEPTDALAAHALWEAVRQHAATWKGSPSGAPLIVIQAVQKDRP